MHDPHVRIFLIPNIFVLKKSLPPTNYFYRPALITVWHQDPETDGSDDSCGWSFPRVSKELKQQVKELAIEESTFLIGELSYEKTPFELIYACWQLIGWRLFRRNGFSYKELARCISLATDPMDNLRHCTAIESDEDLIHLFHLVLLSYLRLHRPWYKHPRWHFWHWKIQFHPWESFKRSRTRCTKCGKRFGWGGVAQTLGMGESQLYHGDCLDDGT